MPQSPRLLRGPSLLVLFVLVPMSLFWWCLSGAAASGSLDIWFPAEVGGMIAGSFYWHRFRGLGFVPLAAFLSAGAGAWGALSGWGPIIVAVPPFCLGFAYTQMISYLSLFPRYFTRNLLVVVLWGVSIVGPVTISQPMWSAPEATGLFTASLAVLALVYGIWLFRPLFELVFESILWVMYKIRTTGPDLEKLPVAGPCIVIANHACWLDPLFLAKVLPRPTTPMMTSRFYDKPGLRFLAKRVFHIIRVPEKTFKQDAQEIQEAVAALDRGECLMIFPEGALRRTEEKPLRRFGRGVWQILVARPDTPVFACWIEGGWGSYTSFFNGNPTQNKRPDFRRPIQVAVAQVTVDAEALGNHLRTRLALMNRVAEARGLLGLPQLPAYELPSQGESESDGSRQQHRDDDE